MLGVVLLSEYNELIHAFGNAPFRGYFFSGRSYSEGQGQLSSSSGISSSASSSAASQSSPPARRQNDDGNNEAATAVEKGATTGEDVEQSKAHMDQQEEEKTMLNEGLLLQQLMPIVALTRTTREQQHQQQPVAAAAADGIDDHQIQCIQSGDALQVRVASLPFSNLLLLIHAENIFPSGSASSDNLFQSLLRCVDFHYGPQLQLLPLGSPLAQQLQRRCEQRMLDLLTRAEAATMAKSVEGGGQSSSAQREQQTFTSPAEDDEEDEQRAFNQELMFGDNNQQQFMQSTLMPRLRELTNLMAKCVGRRCRCLFLHSGRLFASSSSHPPGESVLTSIPAEQLHSILQFGCQLSESSADQQQKARNNNNNTAGYMREKGAGGGGLKCQMEQNWLHSKTLRRRQLHNLFVLSLNEHVEMVVLAAAEQAQLIGTINDCLELLEQMGIPNSSSTPIDQLVDKWQQLWESGAQRLLAAFEPPSSGLKKRIGRELFQGGGWMHGWDCLDNVHKTRAMIQQLWSRFRVSLNTFTHQQQQQDQAQTSPAASSSSITIHSVDSSHRRRQIPRLLMSASSQSLLSASSHPEESHHYTNSTVSSVYSTLGWNSSRLSAATFSSNSRFGTATMDAMKAQLKRVLRSLLNELLTWSSGLARTQTLPRLQTTMRHLMGRQLANVFTQLDQQIGQRWAQGSPLRPARLGLDMLAYRFTRLDGPPLFFQFAEETNREMFSQLCEAFPTMPASSGDSVGNEEEMMVARTSDGQLFLQFKTRCFPEEAPTSRNNNNNNKLFPKLTFGGGLAKARDFVSAAFSTTATPTSSRKSEQQCQCVVHFSRHVNLTLAMKQAERLIGLMAEQMEKCQRNFH